MWILLKERVRKKERNTNLFFQPLNHVQLPELQLQRQLTVIDAFVLTLFCDHVFSMCPCMVSMMSQSKSFKEKKKSNQAR